MVRSLLKKLSENKALALVLMLSFALRLLFSLDNAKALFVDIESYDKCALHILRLGFFGIDTYHPPGYPFLLAAIYTVFGHGYLHVYGIQSIVGMLNTLLIYLIARNAFKKQTGLLSAVLSLLYWPLTMYSGILMSETFFIFFLLLGVYTAFKGIDTGYKIYFAISGGCIAFSTLIRSINLLLIFIIPVVYLLTRTHKLKAAFKNMLVFAAVFCFIMAPWTVRNYVMFQEFIPVDSLGGLNLYIGNNENSGATFMDVTGDKVFNVSDEELAGANILKKAAIRDGKLKKAAMDYMLSNPGRLVQNTLTKAKLFAIFDFKQLDWVLTDYMKENFIFRSNVWNIIIYYSDIAFFVLGALGLIRLLRTKKGLILSGFIGYYFILTSFFYISSRYRLPIMPFMAISAALAVEWAAQGMGNAFKLKSSKV